MLRYQGIKVPSFAGTRTVAHSPWCADQKGIVERQVIRSLFLPMPHGVTTHAQSIQYKLFEAIRYILVLVSGLKATLHTHV